MVLEELIKKFKRQVMMNMGDDVACELNRFKYLDKNAEVYIM
jgi:hypothetical protein